MRILFALGLAAALPACATITEGSDQNVVIKTNPAGAECQLLRAGVTVAVVNPTPGVATLSKSQDDISVSCSKEDFQSRTVGLQSSFQGATLGNVLLGGIVGVAIDAGSGAMNKYPDELTVILPPVNFASEEERDSYYAEQHEAVEAEFEQARTKPKKECDDDCEDDLAVLEQSKQVQLAELERFRKSSVIATPTVAR